MKKRRSKRPPWERKTPKPRAKRKKLGGTAKRKAKRRAAKSGRPYPNLVDNMWAAKKVKS